MMRLLKCEFLKARRCYIFLTALALTAVCLLWAFYGKYPPDILRLGWRMFLYQLPLVNTIFLPFMAAVIASRICGPEHKGLMLKQLCCMEKRGSLFDVKLLCGLGIMGICVLLMWAATIIFGNYIGFEGTCPIRLYLLYLLFTLVPTLSIYLFHHILSMVFQNQAISFFAGIIGWAVGLFSMFLPSLPWLRKSVLWGYYGALSFVGLFDWNKETRYANAHFDLMPVDWLAFVLLLIATFILYGIGKFLFLRKEI